MSLDKKKHLYIDLFAGCGGLSLGLCNSSSWKGVFAIEKSPHAFETLEFNLIKQRNHFSWPDWLPQKAHDINNVLIEYKSELDKLKGELDLVVGGPPCQGFSTAGRRVESDKRNSLIKSYVKFIKLVQPKLIFFENVKGFTQKFENNKTKGKRYSDYVINALKRKSNEFPGYKVHGKLVDFSEYGIPQKRTRFILIGIRNDLKTSFTPEMFFENLDFSKEAFLTSKGLATKTTLEEAISDLRKTETIDCPDSPGFKSAYYNKPASSYQKFLRRDTKVEIPDSHRFANHKVDTEILFKSLLKNIAPGKRIAGEERKEYNIKKRSIVILDKDSPSPTLTSHPDDYVHYQEPRILTVREYARIQSFPDNYLILGKYTTGGKQRVLEVPRYTQLGNAIPPLFGELAGETMLKLI
ncbi:DNA cytosine methyltransferase [Croceimicrobium sp.]|uniref:DNA cytosine methyltransferase n=1 Tax=Croceimicrobium sp. TaxID=2828340 RepID=UPI003BAD4B58